MYRICVNGEEERLEQVVTIGVFLKKKGYRIQRIAVEKNGKIVSRNNYDDTVLEEGDQLEIVSFVGGG